MEHQNLTYSNFEDGVEVKKVMKGVYVFYCKECKEKHFLVETGKRIGEESAEVIPVTEENFYKRNN